MADPALSRMRGAVADTRAALTRQREQIEAARAALAAERRQEDDAARRGRLAREIGDGETAGIAERFAARHAERAGLLERKVAVLLEEGALMERDLAEMLEQLDRAERGGAGGPAGPAAEVRTPTEESELLRSRMDRAAREKTAEDQLAALKRKMGK
ncbi:MAG TPA: hypothetical protein VD793_02600 [Gemmatimonadales bacterium]|nr:hypothetical protein [Gemmatimonadales bacterium]